MRNIIYPFTAIVGQEDMKLALILNAINPSIGGVLIKGEKGTAKSTAVRALANVLPEYEVVADCPYNCPPGRPEEMCRECSARYAISPDNLPRTVRKMRVVNLPINASEDRVVGTLDLEKALKQGELHFSPGVLAEANRNILYVDEVNLLDDHIVDLLLDAAAMGVNIVEREGISYNHPARFLLVGTMNPEEGDLRPQLLDRFGLSVEIGGIKNIMQRVEIVERRRQFEQNPEAFLESYAGAEQELAGQITSAIVRLPGLQVSRTILEFIARLNIELDIDGHRGDIVTGKAAQAYAAYRGAEAITHEHVRKVAEMALSHRLHTTSFERVTRTVGETLQKIK
jgi:Mg-chelatase subunit ChlI